jgi:hypothetical protein
VFNQKQSVTYNSKGEFLVYELDDWRWFKWKNI